MEWRNTPWRQGHVIAAEDWRALGFEPLQENRFAVVITHDCDIAAEVHVEPSICEWAIKPVKPAQGALSERIVFPHATS
jgi:hypothetical protein